MSKSEAKKDHILASGLEVMKANGYNGTSVKDIVEAAEVPKGSFYNYFESKEVFAVEAIEKAAADNLRAVSEMLRRSDIPPLQRLEEFFATNVEGACEGDFRIGCFLGNMCQEMADNCETIRLKIKCVLGDTTALIEDVLRQAQSDGTLAAERDPAIMAEFLFNAWEGALMRMKASKCREPLDAFLTMLPVVVNS
jgi:TetR/AcrR family transcriptional repressor of nem operon